MVWAGKKWLEVERNGWRFQEMVWAGKKNGWRLKEMVWGERNGWILKEMVGGWKKWSTVETRNGRRFQEMAWGGKKWLDVERNGWRFQEMVGGEKKWLEFQEMVRCWQKWFEVERNGWIEVERNCWRLKKWLEVRKWLQVERNGWRLKKWLKVERNGWRLKKWLEFENGWKLKEMVEGWKKWLKVEREDWILINMWHVCIFILTLIRKGGGAGEDLGDIKLNALYLHHLKIKISDCLNLLLPAWWSKELNTGLIFHILIQSSAPYIITVDRHSKGYNWMKLNWIGLGRIGRKYRIKKNWACSEWLRTGSVRFLVNYKDRKGLNLI